jgi:ADP-heptose:LPS heptosyltransferase
VSGFGEKVRVLQWLDRRVGVPACAVATGLRRIADAFRGAPSTAPARSIVFVKLAEQGSTVLAFDAIQRAVTKVGAENVYFLVFENNRFIVDLLGLIPPENVLAVRSKSAAQMAFSGLGQLRRLRRLRVDVCIDMEFFTRFSALIAWLTGARLRVGFHTYFGEGPYRGDLMTHRVLYNPHLHTARSFTSLVQALDQEPARFPTFPAIPPHAPAMAEFKPSAAERTEAQAIIRALGVGEGQRLVLLNANASDLLPLRKWDGDNYVALARRLLAEFPEVAIAFTGAPSEAPAITALVERVGSPRCHCLAGRTTLRQLLVVYGFSEVLVTNDSGPAHFASMTTIDVVALFGPETPALFAALGPRSHPVWLGIACSPCVNAFNNRQTACRDNQCMKQIAVDDVFRLTAEILRGRASAPRR